MVDDIFVNTLDENIQKSYRKHASSAVYKILDKKIEKSDLDLIFERNEEKMQNGGLRTREIEKSS